MGIVAHKHPIIGGINATLNVYYILNFGGFSILDISLLKSQIIDIVITVTIPNTQNIAIYIGTSN